jgi:hypothetical protein
MTHDPMLHLSAYFLAPFTTLAALLALGTGASAGTAALAASKGCLGTFVRESQGYLASEGGAEPTDDRRQKGEQGLFLYFDMMDGERYFRLEGGDEHKARAVMLKPGCKLPRLRPGGKY